MLDAPLPTTLIAPSPGKATKFGLLELGRGVAAALVVFHHAIAAGVAFHLVVEAPLTNWVRRALGAKLADNQRKRKAGPD
jgi:peptidoglycan/LPS O-acetylase OafA/YrhL